MEVAESRPCHGLTRARCLLHSSVFSEMKRSWRAAQTVQKARAAAMAAPSTAWETSGSAARSAAREGLVSGDAAPDAMATGSGPTGSVVRAAAMAGIAKRFLRQNRHASARRSRCSASLSL